MYFKLKKGINLQDGVLSLDRSKCNVFLRNYGCQRTRKNRVLHRLDSAWCWWAKNSNSNMVSVTLRAVVNTWTALAIGPTSAGLALAQTLRISACGPDQARAVEGHEWRHCQQVVGVFLDSFTSSWRRSSLFLLQVLIVDKLLG